ncbi:polyamine aminopropyltransferase [Desulfothermus okinawensis JCM 13304]
MTISIMLLAMGIGARISKKIDNKSLLQSLILTEICISLVVSFSVYLSYIQAPYSDRLSFFIYFMCFLVGALIGMEIPLAVRINESFEELRENISNILEKDYLGALPGGILYGYFFLPKLGLIYTPIIVGSINLLVAGLIFISFSKQISKKLLLLYILSITLILSFAFIAKPIYLNAEQKFYRDPIVKIKQTKYQKVVLTRWMDDYLLYLDGHLQLSTVDEYRYHEAIVHIPVSIVRPEKVLVIGGGDGCVIRELEKYKHIKSITMVDIDKEFVEFAKKNNIMRQINKDSFFDKRVRIFFEDGFKFVENYNKKNINAFDLIIIDLTDPRNIRSARLYTREFYTFLYNILSPKGAVITQASSPFFARKTFCCVLKTMSSANFYSYPMAMSIPSFGEWGFILGLKEKFSNTKLKTIIYKNFNEKNTRYFTKQMAISIFNMPKNFTCKNVKINTLINPIIIRYYDDKMWDLL